MAPMTKPSSPYHAAIGLGSLPPAEWPDAANADGTYNGLDVARELQQSDTQRELRDKLVPPQDAAQMAVPMMPPE